MAETSEANEKNQHQTGEPDPEQPFPAASRPEANPLDDPAALYRRAEYLLDEMLLSAVDVSSAATAMDDHGPAEIGSSTDTLRAEIDTLLATDVPQAQIRPNSQLPSIRSGAEAEIGAAQVAPLDGTPTQSRPQPAATTPTSAGQEETETEAGSRPRRQPFPVRSSTGLTPPARPITAPERVPAQAGTESAANLSPTSISVQEAEKLEAEIGVLSEEVKQAMASRREMTGHALALLREARTIVMTQPERIGRADYNVRQVRTLLERAKENRRRASIYGTQLLVYLSLWLMVCVGGTVALFLYRVEVEQFVAGLAGPRSRLIVHTVPFLWTTLAGGIGGVVGAIIALSSHIRAGQDFDRQYVVRYLIQPVMGVVLGVFIYFLFVLLFNLLGADLAGNWLVALLPGVVALPAGLWQELVYGLLYRITTFLTLRPRRR